MDYDEDRCQIRTGAGAETMATTRNTTLSLLRLAGPEEHRRRPTPPPRSFRQHHHTADRVQNPGPGAAIGRVVHLGRECRRPPTHRGCGQMIRVRLFWSERQGVVELRVCGVAG